MFPSKPINGTLESYPFKNLNIFIRNRILRRIGYQLYPLLKSDLNNYIIII